MIRVSRSFLKGSLIYTIVGALPMASAILLLPFYMVGLSGSDFGALSVYLTFSLLIQLLVAYSFDTSLYIHYHEFKSDKRKLATFVSSAFVLMILIGIGLMCVLVPTGNYLFKTIFTDKGVSFYPYGLLALGGGMFQALVKVHSNFLQSREKPETFFWSNLMLFSAIVLFTISGLHFFPQSLLGPLGGRALALSLASCWVLIRIFREFGVQFNFTLLSESFSFNFYSFIYQLQQWVINYFDRILMVFFLPISTVGMYDFAIKCLLGIEFLMGGLHNSFYPKVVKEIMGQKTKGSSPTINRYYNGLIAVVMLVVCAAIFVLPFLINWLADQFDKPDYKQAIEFIPFIALLYLFRCVRLYFGYPYGVLKYTKPLPVIYFAAAFVKIAGMLLLIDYYGVKGVILAAMMSQVIEMLLLHRQMKERFLFQFNIVKVVVAPLVMFIVIFLVESLISKQFQSLAHASYVLLCFLLLLWTYRNELKQIDIFRIIR